MKKRKDDGCSIMGVVPRATAPRTRMSSNLHRSVIRIGQTGTQTCQLVRRLGGSATFVGERGGWEWGELLTKGRFTGLVSSSVHSQISSALSSTW